jgi:hypothetical protein
MTPPERVADMSIPEILDHLLTLPVPGGDSREHPKIVLQVRLAELQDASARAIARGTGSLVGATSRLVWATWGLVAATAGLVVTEIVFKVIGK